MGEHRPQVPTGPPSTRDAARTRPEAQRTEESQAARMGELIMRIFLHIRQRLRTLSTEDNADNGLSVTETLVLWTISTAGPMKFHSLSRQVGVPVSTLTTMVDRMEARGFLRRRPDKDDRRAIFIEGTPDLARIKERHTALIRSEMQSVVARLAPDQVLETLRGLDHMARALKEETEPTAGPATACTADPAVRQPTHGAPQPGFGAAAGGQPGTGAGKDER